ncbi:unnamed protein product [Lathyrus oleraceus]|uniref:Uncharacterized protein n=1 Tax=Pisum sativum TaxID=3888 RepID=A0A9D4YQ95_PEA|nr:hypothetical protein KIW84_011207 [Pisum sativum]
MASEPNKKRKIDELQQMVYAISANRSRVSSKNGKNVITATNANGSMVASERVSEKKYLATTQAQEDGCTGNYKIFDSPFANFLLPVIPTPAELS